MDLESKIQAIHDDVLIIKDRQFNVITTLEKHEKTIYGNGKTGITERLAITERLVKILCGGAVIIAVAIVGLAVKASGQNTPVQMKSGWDQPGGLNTSKPGHLIPENDFTDLGDVFTDNGPYVEKRGGLTTLYNTGKSYPINQIYENIKLDGKRYGIVKSSGDLAYIGTDNSYNVLLSTLSESSRLWMVQYNNDCYLGTSAKEDRWRFDGSYLYISTYVPCSKYPIIYFDKMFAINISTPRANETQITTSGDESVIRYSRIGDLKEWDGDFRIGVNRNDGDTITGSFVYRGNLYVTKTNSVHQIVRVDNEDNTDGERAVPVLSNIGCISQDSIKEVNGVMYWVSNQGVIEFNGTSYKIVSEDVKDDINDIIEQSNTGISSIAGLSDTLYSDFNLGTKTDVDISRFSGSVIISSDPSTNTIHQRNDNSSTYTELASVGDSCYQTFQTSYTVYLSTVDIYMVSGGGISNVLVSVTVTNGRTGTNYIMDKTLSISGTWYQIIYSTHEILLEQGYNHKFTVTFKKQTGTNVPRIFKSVDNPYPYGMGDGNPSIDYAFRVSCYGYKKEGMMQSNIKSVPANFSQWGQLLSNYGSTSNNGGTNIKWYVSASTASALVGLGHLHPMSTGYVINLSSYPFIMWIASMTTTDVYNSPKIDDVVIQYYYNNPSYTMCGYSDQNNLRYGMAGTKSPSSINNVVYWYQLRNGKWTKHNIQSRFMTNFKNDFIIGTSTNSGKIFKYSSEYNTDDGATITPYVKTKDYVLSTRMTDNKINELWAYVEPSTNYSTMTITYFPNLKDTAWTLYSDVGLTAVTGYQDMFIKKKLVVRDLDRIRTLGVKFTNFDKLFGFDLLYTTYPPGER